MSQVSFNLEAAITQWRLHLTSGGITEASYLDELESHLRDDIDNLIKTGLADSEAFVIATYRIGEPALIRNEFKKVPSQRRYRAYELILFVSLVLLAVSTTDKPGVAARFVLGIGLFSFVQFTFIRSGVLNHMKLARIRPYALLANVIFAVLFTSPQIVIQAVSALVLQLLFEIDVWYARLQERQIEAARE